MTVRLRDHKGRFTRVGQAPHVFEGTCDCCDYESDDWEPLMDRFTAWLRRRLVFSHGTRL